MSPSARVWLLTTSLVACAVTDKDGTTSDPPSSSGATTTASSSGDAGTTAEPTTADPTTANPTTNPSTDPTADPSTTTATTGDTGVPAVSFTEVYEQVIMVHGCNAGYCHGGSAGGLEMTDEATTYANLVEVKATTALCDQSMRVAPGAPDESILWYRVRPAAQDGMNTCAKDDKMPKVGDGLDDTQAQLVRDWIAGGALE